MGVNDFNIFKRGKLWTKYSVSRIIKNLENDNYVKYLYEDNDENISSKENSNIMEQEEDIEKEYQENKIYENPSFLSQLSSSIMNFMQNGNSKI